MSISISSRSSSIKQDYLKTQIEERKKVLMDIQEKQQEPMPRENYNDYTLMSITNRLNAGRKLSEMELSYLRLKSPEDYAKAKSAEKAKKSLSQKLKLCKTKGQVLALRINVTQTAVFPNCNKSTSSPSQQPSDMLKLTGIDAYAYHATNREWNHFKNSKAYLRLPYHLRKNIISISKKV